MKPRIIDTVLDLLFFAIAAVLFAQIGNCQLAECLKYKDEIRDINSDRSSPFSPVDAMAQLDVESGCKANAVSKYAQGIAQFTPQTAREVYPKVGCSDSDLLNAECGIKANHAYMAELYQPYSLTTESPKTFTRAAYDGGSGWIRREVRRCRVLPNCNPRRWDNNVAKICLRNRNACKENREYPIKIESKIPLYEGVFSND